MWPTSPSWDAAWRDGGQVFVRAEVWRGGALQTLPDGSTSLRVSGGAVAVDEGSKTRRKLSLSVANTDLDPVSATDLLAPFGTDLKVFMGIGYTDGTVEYAPVGVFRLTTPARPSLFAPLSLTADDYSSVLAGDRFLAPWVTSPGTLVTAEIRAMALASVPSLTVLDFTGSRAVTSAVTWERDRWDAMIQLAQSIGAEVFFDPTGALVIRPVPQLVGTPVWSCDAGSAAANLLDVAVGMSSEGVYNAVVATSTPPGRAPLAAVVYQRSGPMAWSSTFRRPRFWATQMPMTLDGLYATGAAILAKSVTAARQLDPSSVPNPALDAGDPIAVQLPSGWSENRFLSRFTLPLEPGAMPLTTRVPIDAAFAALAAGLS